MQACGRTDDVYGFSCNAMIVLLLYCLYQLYRPVDALMTCMDSVMTSSCSGEATNLLRTLVGPLMPQDVDVTTCPAITGERKVEVSINCPAITGERKVEVSTTAFAPLSQGNIKLR